MPATKAAARPRRSAVKATFQAPSLPDLPKPDNGRPTHHNGVEIVEETRLPSPLPKAGPLRITRLTLSDGETAHGCWDCKFTSETRGDIVTHRNAEHGGRVGKNRVRKDDLVDVVLPVRPDGSPPPDTTMDMTIREITMIAPSLKVFFDHLDAKERECEELAAELAKQRLSLADQHKIEVYASHQQEIGELRALLAKQGNYDEVKNELYALRAWKKKMIQKLSALGFHLSEEDQ